MQLHFETIDQNTKETLHKLMNLEILESFYLVGGTALALQLGHRKSIDLDFFGKVKVHYDDIIEQCKSIGLLEAPQQYTGARDQESRLIQFNLNKIKIDILQYQEVLIKPIIKLENLRLASLEDIAAMKIRAIEDRTTKKDYYDIYALLNLFSLKEILDFSKKKYNSKSPVFSLECLLDINQADSDIEPVSLLNLEWSTVKAKIINEAKRILL